MSNLIIKKTVTATKWSVVTELLAKCISPITTMILARILAPEAFGVLTTVLMVIAFAEVFVESGFQKYLVQHDFENCEQERKYMSVAFWANLFFSLCIWGIIILLNEEIAELVGSEGNGYLLIITGMTIPLYGIIGIQNCKLKKDLKFEKLFYVRIAAAMVPVVITIPLALLGMEHWALIIGNIAGVAVNSIVLVMVKSFSPMLYFSWNKLVEMLQYGIWTLLNGIAVWFSSWLDAFLIGRLLTEYYLGLYKNSVNIITSIITTFTAAIVPVLFVSLSRLKEDDMAFKKVFLGIQKVLCMFLIPMGVGVFLYQGLATDILLGKQWGEASRIIGITALMLAFRTVFISLNGDVFRAKGHFAVPLVLEIMELILTIPVCYMTLVKCGFWEFVYVRALMKLILIVPEILLLWKYCNIRPLLIVKNAFPSMLSTSIMSIVAILLQQIFDVIWWNVFSILVCIVVYLVVILIIPSEREEIIGFVKGWLKPTQYKEKCGHEKN